MTSTTQKCRIQPGKNASVPALLHPTCVLASMQAALAEIVDGLFSAVAALGVVPIIRCPQVRPPPPLPCHLQSLSLDAPTAPACCKFMA